MACNLISNGYEIGCRDSVGGIKKIYISNFDKAGVYTKTNGEIVSFATATTPQEVYYEFEQVMESASFAQTGTFSTENGTTFFDQQLTLIFRKQDNDLRNHLIALSQGHLSVIIQDQNGAFWLLGESNGVYALSADIQSGKAFGDMNGVTIVLQGKEGAPATAINAATEQDLTTLGFVIA